MPGALAASVSFDTFSLTPFFSLQHVSTRLQHPPYYFVKLAAVFVAFVVCLPALYAFVKMANQREILRWLLPSMSELEKSAQVMTEESYVHDRFERLTKIRLV